MSPLTAVVDLRVTDQVSLFERRRVRHRRVECPENADRRVERLERLLLDDRGEALADAAGAGVLLDDQHPIAVAGDAQHRFAIERHQRPQVQHARLDPVSGQTRCHAQRGVHVGAVRNDRHIVAGAAKRGLAERNRQDGRREPLLDPRIAIERDVLVIEHRIGIGDRSGHQRPRIGRRGRHDDLEAGCAVEPGLGVLAVIRAGVTQAAPRHAQDHRDRAAPPVADLRRVVDQHVEAGRDEVVELHLANRALPGERRADADAEHRPFREDRVLDAIAELGQQRPQQQEGVAVRSGHVFAEDERARIGTERIPETERDALEERLAGGSRTAARYRPAAMEDPDRSPAGSPDRAR